MESVSSDNRRRIVHCAIALCLLTAAAVRAPAQNEPFRNAALPADVRARDLIGRLSLEEKFWQLFMIPGDLDDPANDYSRGIFGLQISAVPNVPAERAARAHAERINTIQRFFVERTRFGIPIIPFDEALHGLMREGATVFPQAIGLAATFDSALVGRVADAIARETRSRGVRQVLSPVVNIANDVRWGRVEETYGEDPYLSSVMGRSFVRAFERSGVIATPKHFVANVGDGGRDSYPIDLSARLLEEVHFPPFRAAVREAGARSVMTAYNSVDGRPATQNGPLLNDKLKGDWGFRGFVISDAAATGGATVLHHTEANTASAAKHAFEAGLDVVFQSSFDQHRPYLAAFQQRLIADSVIDAALSRVLRAKFELGLFERPFVDADSAAYWNGHLTHRALARDAARAAVVLLRNVRQTLPLGRSLKSLAISGTDAREARLGGYSASTTRATSILDGLRAALGTSTTIRYAPGPGRLAPEHVVIAARHLSHVANGQTHRGVRGEYFANNRLEGEPAIARSDSIIDFRWTLNSPGRGIPFDWYSARWRGTLTAPTLVRRIGIEGNDGYRLWLNGRLLIDNWTKRSYGTRAVEIAWTPGSRHDVRLEFFESTGNARVKLVWDAGVSPNGWRASVDSAVALARRSDVAVVVAGIE
ncbi:MAG TPA: glycoside hydrolase family 3 N-terminal domain-containing protein, partial [Gemmatimonadaceae bacterium]|nr:glycoside hydrolase family 3 N-terminal domain-containing protein [Gemmatimonadaceae bacterium]